MWPSPLHCCNIWRICLTFEFQVNPLLNKKIVMKFRFHFDQCLWLHWLMANWAFLLVLFPGTPVCFATTFCHRSPSAWPSHPLAVLLLGEVWRESARPHGKSAVDAFCRGDGWLGCLQHTPCCASQTLACFNPQPRLHWASCDSGQLIPFSLVFRHYMSNFSCSV